MITKTMKSFSKGTWTERIPLLNDKLLVPKVFCKKGYKPAFNEGKLFKAKTEIKYNGLTLSIFQVFFIYFFPVIYLQQECTFPLSIEFRQWNMMFRSAVRSKEKRGRVSTERCSRICVEQENKWNCIEKQPRI